MRAWLEMTAFEHDTSYLKPIVADHPMLRTPAAELGRRVGEHILRHKEIMGLFDTFCMGMINGVFPQKALVDIGMPLESLSQSALLAGQGRRCSRRSRETCLRWYETATTCVQAYGDPPPSSPAIRCSSNAPC